MLYYDRVEVSEELDFDKTSESKECDVCHYWYFLNKGFKFQSYVCNGCHDLSDIAISEIKDFDCCCIISRTSQSKAINLM